MQASVAIVRLCRPDRPRSVALWGGKASSPLGSETACRRLLLGFAADKGHEWWDVQVVNR